MFLIYQGIFFVWYLLSLLPLWVLHGFSNILYLIVFYGIGYRKKVVLENLQKSFPLLSPAEHQKLVKQYYLHLCDLVVETIKSRSISQESLLKRLKIKNITFMHQRIAEGKSIMILTSHVGNWEWHLPLVKPLGIRGVAIYQPLSNPYFDAHIRKTRFRFGAELVPMQQIAKRLLELHKAGIQHLSWFAADQAPRPENAFWTTFLHQDTPFHTGYEKLAMRLQCEVVYFYVRKIGRSLYELEIIPLHTAGEPLHNGELVQRYIQVLEKQIQENPAYWLWSHKRWKHSR